MNTKKTVQSNLRAGRLATTYDKELTCPLGTVLVVQCPQSMSVINQLPVCYIHTIVRPHSLYTFHCAAVRLILSQNAHFQGDLDHPTDDPKQQLDRFSHFSKIHARYQRICQSNQQQYPQLLQPESP